MSAGSEERLRAALSRHERLTVAVSGGVDSMTLAFLAHRWAPRAITMFHAVSPAVPQSATERVKRHAERWQWPLEIGGAGEFEDVRYRENPVDRCYFCKSNLYDRIRALVGTGTIASGANIDDLGDYRPGLMAAAERGVVHPYVEADIDKETVRALASSHGLDDLAELPSQPCLASRIETGIAISADDLAFIDHAETALAALLPQGTTLRCRVTHFGIVVEVPPPYVGTPALEMEALVLCAQDGRGFAGIRPYARGSAFLGKPAFA